MTARTPDPSPDPFRYVLAPNGGLESGAAQWKLTGGAKVENGNETFYVGGKTDTKSLYLPSGSSATTRPMCVQLLHPTLRYFAKNRGTPVLSSLLVEALIENPLNGKVLKAPERSEIDTQVSEQLIVEYYSK